jgi:hypothetical protein
MKRKHLDNKPAGLHLFSAQKVSMNQSSRIANHAWINSRKVSNATSITNVPKSEADARTIDLRNAIEHRATWFYLLLDEAEQAGVDWEKIGRQAIFRCGCFHGHSKFTPTADLREFAIEFANENVKKIFEMDIKEMSDDRFYVEFNYCPLVTAWLKQTKDEKKIEMLCDIAMDGDRGIINEFPSFEFRLGDTIAKGGKVCGVEIVKK